MKNRLKPQSGIKALFGVVVLCLLPNLFFAQNTTLPTTNAFRGGANKNGVYPGSDFNSISGTKWQFKTGAAVRSTPLVDAGEYLAFVGGGAEDCRVWGRVTALMENRLCQDTGFGLCPNTIT